MNMIRLYFNELAVDEELLGFTGEWLENDWFEIGSSNAQMMRVGDLVECEYLLQRHNAKVARITLDRVYLYRPDYMKRDGNERRNNRRYPVELFAKLAVSLQQLNDFPESTIPIQLNEINLGGIGFVTLHSRMILTGRYLLQVDSEALVIEAQIQIMHCTDKNNGVYYGAEILFMKREDLDRLRMLLLYLQYAGNNVEMNR